MDVLAGIIVLLIAAKILGELVEYAGYPSLIGEIIAGIILGPSVFNLIEVTPVIRFFSTIGVILLLFITGVEINQKIFRSARRRMIVTGLVAAIIPFIIGYILGALLTLSADESLFIGVVFMLTSIGISVRTLLEERQLNTDFGMTIVGGAVVCAVSGIIIFGILSSLKAEGIVTHESLLRPLLVAIVFILAMTTVGKKTFQFIYDRVQLLHNHSLTYAVAFLIACTSAFFSQALGLTVVVGAFFAGITLNKSVHEDHDIHESLNNTAFGIFITVFFASVGLIMNIPAAEMISPLILILIVGAVAVKVIAGFIGSYPFLKDRNSAFLVGLGMIPRGDLTLALAGSAIVAGIISQQVYTATVLVVLVTVLVTPVFLKIGLARMRAHRPDGQVSGAASEPGTQ
ncbi:cation:proton antiporter [Methanoregula sp.]|uniref:cation:proton antiporter n=1 Tax=Methanoregula sp. TaxID=2052170 RepID=UPI00236C6892|nr:cation:proton antiporter [Methanoregula sp.]MDD1687250.1 cation:proton antiporter [Methanoregula sp.]